MKVTIDAVVEFERQLRSGRLHTVRARVSRTRFDATTDTLTYIWEDVRTGLPFTTCGIPRGYRVVADTKYVGE